ncbi:MAG: hypothetical protein EFKGCFLK_02292 [Rhodocyclaceae bacterium]|nr:hypothetical protein [Rhodocyclaceae bacterium]CAG0931910.1 hypothetical protein RHDC3_02029 [Rhodocyclaceae bacterium]
MLLGSFFPLAILILAVLGSIVFGLLAALNLQTAFLSPPHVTLNQIFAGMMPFMGIQVLALVLLYTFPDIGLWLPKVLYK